MTVCYRCRVKGRVQGVFFRASTREEASALGLTGYARNLPDGSVEVLVCGVPDTVDRLREWLWQGPPLARVESVVCEKQLVDDVPQEFLTA